MLRILKMINPYDIPLCCIQSEMPLMLSQLRTIKTLNAMANSFLKKLKNCLKDWFGYKAITQISRACVPLICCWCVQNRD